MISIIALRQGRRSISQRWKRAIETLSRVVRWMFLRRGCSLIIRGLGYFLHLAWVFWMLRWAILYSRQQSLPARRLSYRTSLAILQDGNEDGRFLESTYVNDKRRALRPRMVDKKRDFDWH